MPKKCCKARPTEGNPIEMLRSIEVPDADTSDASAAPKLSSSIQLAYERSCKHVNGMTEQRVNE
ncbi:hypothetical protein Hypma_014486 [Hypsizygus marmoreus]|uniref:Uncharacterized protein n=1 Tax=Hypsizygus marmoreus TaxID=39966 RepID=A0A369JDX2_HYPMA|nr:hypothetical protein Hypma_014486 [Hypsizygus marmoreus]